MRPLTYQIIPQNIDTSAYTPTWPASFIRCEEASQGAASSHRATSLHPHAKKRHMLDSKSSSLRLIDTADELIVEYPSFYQRHYCTYRINTCTRQVISLRKVDSLATSQSRLFSTTQHTDKKKVSPRAEPCTSTITTVAVPALRMLPGVISDPPYPCLTFLSYKLGYNRKSTEEKLSVARIKIARNPRAKIEARAILARTAALV